MPKAQLPVGAAKIDALGYDGPASWANVFYAIPTAFDPTHLQDVAALCAAAMHAFYHDAIGVTGLTNSWRYDRTRVVFRDATDSVYRATLIDAYAGTEGSDLMPAQNCMMINWQTGDPRKGGKPRSYLAGQSEGVLQDTATWKGAAVTAVAGRIVTWIEDNLTRTSGTANGIVFGEMSFRNGNAWRETPIFYPFIAGTPSTVLATQRRRVDRLRG